MSAESNDESNGTARETGNKGTERKEREKARMPQAGARIGKARRRERVQVVVVLSVGLATFFKAPWYAWSKPISHQSINNTMTTT